MTIPSEAAAREQDRLHALDRFDILDTPPEETFDRLTRVVRRAFGVPMSTLTFIDGHRQWFKSRAGIVPRETGKGPALCRVALEGGEPLVVPDTHADPRFRDNPFVVGPPGIRFYAGVPLRTADGYAIGTLCAMGTEPRAVSADEAALLVDLGRLAMELLELRLQATTDALTGTLMRRAFRTEAERALALALRHGHDVACLMLDLDHFKQVNDTHGHATGDKVLRAAAAAIRTTLRTSDLVGRVGGEEFAALLPLTGGAGAIETAGRLRTALAQVRVPTETGPIGVTMSVGIAEMSRGAIDIDALMARADEALYAAKRAGRDGCRAWQPPPGPGTVDGLRRVFKAGRIAFGTGRTSVDCTVRAMSDEGAALDVASTTGIPDSFRLQIEADGLSRLCRLRTKAERRIEVAFA